MASKYPFYRAMSLKEFKIYKAEKKIKKRKYWASYGNFRKMGGWGWKTINRIRKYVEDGEAHGEKYEILLLVKSETSAFTEGSEDGVFINLEEIPLERAEVELIHDQSLLEKVKGLKFTDSFKQFLEQRGWDY